MKKFKKLIYAFSILFCCMLTINVVQAASIEWWDKATSWFNMGSTSVGLSQNVISGLAETIEIIGTGIILIATVVIGMKYMVGTVQGRIEAKENLVQLVVASLLFFGWTNIRDILIVGNATGSNGITGATHLIFFSGGNITATFSQLFTFIVTVAKAICVVAIMYMGVKYIMAGADAKAKIKEQAPALIIGVILIFCAVNVIGFIADVVTRI